MGSDGSIIFSITWVNSDVGRSACPKWVTLLRKLDRRSAFRGTNLVGLWHVSAGIPLLGRYSGWNAGGVAISMCVYT